MHSSADTFQAFPVYARSKLANLMFAHKLQQVIKASSEYKGSILVNALHPGNPVTSVTGNLPPLLRTLETVFYPLMFLYRETCTAGAYCSVWTASSMNAIKKDNQYYIHNASAVKNPAAENE